jgi:hypothetical protein
MEERADLAIRRRIQVGSPAIVNIAATVGKRFNFGAMTTHFLPDRKGRRSLASSASEG